MAAALILAAPLETASAQRAVPLNTALTRAGVPPAERAVYLRSVRDARALANRRGGQTGRELRAVVNSAIRISRQRGFDPATAAVVFREVDANVSYLSSRSRYPGSGTRVRIDGVVYERYTNQGLRIQPLGTYWSILEPGAGVAADGGIGPALEKAHAIAVPRGESLTLPYLFTWMGRQPTWRSAMAEGVAAAAAVRTWERSDDERYLDWAVGFGNAAASLGIPVGEGRWYPLYAFAPGYRVLNGHVQTVLGLGALADATGDEEFVDAFERGVVATKASLRRYDTGGWARYAPGQDAPIKYMRLQITQMKQLGALTGDETFTRQGERWEADLRRPPVVKGPPRPLRPVRLPAASNRAPVVRFRVSRDKPLTLRVAAFTPAGKRLTTYRTYRLSSGRSFISVPLARQTGSIELRANATDWMGNRTNDIRLARVQVR